MDIPQSGAIFTLGKSHLAENSQSYFYIKNDPVKRLIAGPRQSAVICESGRLFVWGENHYGQLGIGHGHGHGHGHGSSSGNNNNNSAGDIITKPTCVKALKTLGLKICDAAFGNDWTVVLTYSNEIFYTGRNIFPLDTHVAQHFTIVLEDEEEIAFIRKPFRLEEFDDYLSKSEETDNFICVQAGNAHFAVLTTTGRLIGCGSNSDQQLGDLEVDYDGHPVEIVLDAPVQQFACGPESTLVLTETGSLFLTGRLQEFVFPKFTELQKNLSPTEQIIFMHISKTSEIYIVTNVGNIYRSFESLRNKSLVFQRFYDYDSEENGPIWKLLKGFSFFAVLSKANKFFTTFSESGHHLKTFREISKFKNLRLLDIAVGDQHILVHGVPRSSTLSATVGPGSEHRYMSRSFVLQPPDVNGNASSARNGSSRGLHKQVAVAEMVEHIVETAEAVKQHNGEQTKEEEQEMKNEDNNKEEANDETHKNTESKNQKETQDEKQEKPKDEEQNKSDDEAHKISKDQEQMNNKQEDAAHRLWNSYNNSKQEEQPESDKQVEAPLEANGNAAESITNDKNQNESKMDSPNKIKSEPIVEHKTAEPLLPEPSAPSQEATPTASPTTNAKKSPTGSQHSQKSTRSIKFDAAALQKPTPRSSATGERQLRPHTPYPESSNSSTPQTIKKTPLRNFSYDVALDHDHIDRTSPELVDSLETVEENADAECKEAPPKTVISTPTPPTEEDEHLAVEITTTKDATDETKVVNEIRFINNGIDVTETVKEILPDTSLEDSLDEVESDAEHAMQEVEEHIEKTVVGAKDKAKELEKAAEKELEKAAEKVDEKAAETVGFANDTMGMVTENFSKVTKNIGKATDSIGEKIESKMQETRDSVQSAMRNAATGARDAVDTVGENAKRVASDALKSVEEAGSNVVKAADETKNVMKQAVGSVTTRISTGVHDAKESISTRVSNEMQGAKDSITTLFQSKAAKEATAAKELAVAAREDDDISSKESGTKTNTTNGFGEDDERTTASVNSNHTSAGNPFEPQGSNNPFDGTTTANNYVDDLDAVVERSKKAMQDDLRAMENRIVQPAGAVVHTEVEQTKGRVRQFFDDVRSKGLSCRSEKAIQVEDEPPPHYTKNKVDSEISLHNGHNQSQGDQNASRVCTIL